MLTPQEVSSHSFTKAVMGGYNMAMVDEFLDELTDDYTALYKENTALKAKMKVLVDKVEEYRATEDSMRAALLAAQKMADSMVSEAESKKRELLAEAEAETVKQAQELTERIAFEQQKLNAVKEATAEFVEQTRRVCDQQLRLLDMMPDLTPEEITAVFRAGQIEQKDISAIGEKILAAFQSPVPQDDQPTAVVGAVESAPAVAQTAEKPVEQSAEKPAAQSAERARFDDESTRPINLAELKFGRNYRAEDEE